MELRGFLDLHLAQREVGRSAPRNRLLDRVSAAVAVVRGTRRSRHLDLLWISLVWLAAALLLRPFQNTPFIDDWVYAWPVERLLTGGDLRVLDFSGSLNPVQIFWGALFSLPAGFSFTALRASTWRKRSGISF